MQLITKWNSVQKLLFSSQTFLRNFLGKHWIMVCAWISLHVLLLVRGNIFLAAADDETPPQQLLYKQIYRIKTLTHLKLLKCGLGATSPTAERWQLLVNPEGDCLCWCENCRKSVVFKKVRIPSTSSTLSSVRRSPRNKRTLCRQE